MHHVQYDAWSLRLLLDDLCRLYKDETPTSSSDLANFLRVANPSMKNRAVQEEYWRSTFPPGFKPALFSLPRAELTRSLSQDSERSVLADRAVLENAKQCEEKARLLGLSIQSIFLACWAQLQAHFTGKGAVTLGVWHAGRAAAVENIERLAVPCMNVLPIYVANAQASVTDIAKAIQVDMRKRAGIIEHSNLLEINEWIGGDGTPLCNVFINIVKTAPNVESQHAILDAVEVNHN
jgi:hypothetical protein